MTNAERIEENNTELEECIAMANALPDANDIVSPTIDVEAIDGGHRLTITDKDGTENFDVMDGKDGADGKSAYQYAVDGGYTGTEAEFASKMAEMTDKARIYYSVITDGIYVNARYSAENDITYYLCKKGPNSIFDFSTIGLVAKGENVSTATTPSKYLVSASGDWHAPYVVKAVNNGNGDNPNSNYFTGGNHSYTNSASGVATGRTANLKMYADGMSLISGDKGYCNSIKLEWDNFIQGYNTTKADGSGREILREHIVMTFDGEVWETSTTIYPLEDIQILTWYGLQFFTANYSYVSYIGGADGIILQKSQDSESGNADTNAMKFFTLTDTAIVEIDNAFDLGKRKHASNTTKSFFARGSYSKAYGTVIGGTASLSNGGAYSMRGRYIFKHEVQYEPSNGGVIPVPSLLKLNRTESNTNASYTAGNCDTWYINPAKSNAVTVSGTPCVVTDLTENTITVKENGTGSTGCAFPIKVTDYLGKSLTFSWVSNGGSNTRISLMGFGNSNAKYITLDKSGTKTSAVIEISADGTTITVDGVANVGNGKAFYSLSFFFGSATGTTTSYTGVSLVENV